MYGLTELWPCMSGKALYGLHYHKRYCGLAGCNPWSVLSGLEPVDAHED